MASIKNMVNIKTSKTRNKEKNIDQVYSLTFYKTNWID